MYVVFAELLSNITFMIFDCGIPTSIIMFLQQCLPERVLDGLPVWQQTGPACLVYILVAIATVAFQTAPLLVYRPQASSQLTIDNSRGGSDLVGKLFSYLKVQLYSLLSSFL